MKKLFLTLSATLLSLSSLRANNDERDWQFKDGTSKKAELVSYDEEKKEATLGNDAGEKWIYALDRFSTVDQAWLIEWSFVTHELTEKLEQSGGRLEHLKVNKKYQTDFYIYHPSGVEDASKRPMLLLFSPTAKAHRMLGNFTESAEKHKVVTVACGEFRNTGDDAELEASFLERFKEALPELEKAIAHDANKLIMAGTSGGAWRAYHFSAWVPRPWLGIIASGGWLGGPKYFDLPYPAGMRVTIVNGSQDRAANRGVDVDAEILQKRGSEVRVMAFEGGHETAPPAHQIEALNWILEPKLAEKPE